MFDVTTSAAVAASREEVWHDLTDAGALTQWFWPPRLDPQVELQPEVGGAWIVRSPVAGMAVLGRVLEFSAPTALRLSWRWEGDDPVTEVAITLADSGPVTRVHVEHAGFATVEQRDDHLVGWHDCLARLVQRHAEASGS